MLRFISTFICLLVYVPSHADMRDTDCESALGVQDVAKVIRQLSESFVDSRASMINQFSNDGLGYVLVKNPNWNTKFGAEFYGQFPVATNMHIDTAWFEMADQVISHNEVIISTVSRGKIISDTFEFPWGAIQTIEKIAQQIRDQLNNSLPEGEEVEIRRIGFLSHHHDSQDLFNSNDHFYEPHLDKDNGELYMGTCYLRAVMTLHGPGTFFWEKYPGKAEQAQAGDVLIFEGEGRQQAFNILRDLLWHQIPNMTGTAQGRLALRIDFQKKTDKPRSLIMDLFKKLKLI